MLRKVILAALAATTLAGPVLAQDWHRDHQDQRGDRAEVRGDRAQVRGDRQELRGDVREGNRGEFRRDAGQYRDDRRELQGDRRDFRGDVRDGRRDFRDDRRADWRWDQNRYRWNGYAYPRGYGYQAWGVGALIDRAFWGQRYWINDWGSYRLSAPYAGTRWIRVGPDALLIRIYDGRVVRAVRGIYY